jgi:hypothetical protein
MIKRRVVNMVKRLALVTLVILAVTAIAYPACASLVPMSWGFPVMIQNSTLTGLQTSTQSATDNEMADISFPTGSGSGGLFGSAFPSIMQNSMQNAFGSNLNFGQQTQSAIFAYPYISIGGSPVPGLGFL